LGALAVCGDRWDARGMFYFPSLCGNGNGQSSGHW
jgi:hypothetical protein